MAGVWLPFKELASIVTSAVLHKQSDLYYTLEAILKKHKPDFISLLQNPVRKEWEREMGREGGMRRERKRGMGREKKRGMRREKKREMRRERKTGIRRERKRGMRRERGKEG